MQFFDYDPLPACASRRGGPANLSVQKQWDEVLGHFAGGPFHDFVWLMAETGCRPQEVRVIEARHFEPEKMSVTFADGEIPGKKYGRTVELTKAATTLLGRLAAQHPSGALFRNSFDNPWTPRASLAASAGSEPRCRSWFMPTWRGIVGATDLIEAGASRRVVVGVGGAPRPHSRSAGLRQAY